MKNTTYTYLALGVAFVILFGVYIIDNNQASTGSISEVQNQDKEVATTSAISIDAQTDEGVVKETAEKPAEPKKVPSSQVNAGTPTPEPIVFGPREKAQTPGNALRFFAEAMRGEDRERALTYIHPNVRAQYEESFETHYSDKQHPVVVAYFTGTVESAKLSQPQNGIYEIVVHSKEYNRPFNSYVVYNSETSEFLLLEL